MGRMLLGKLLILSMITVCSQNGLANGTYDTFLNVEQNLSICARPLIQSRVNNILDYTVDQAVQDVNNACPTEVAEYLSLRTKNADLPAQFVLTLSRLIEISRLTNIAATMQILIDLQEHQSNLTGAMAQNSEQALKLCRMSLNSNIKVFEELANRPTSLSRLVSWFFGK